MIQHVGVKPQISRFPAQELEQFARMQIHLLLRAPENCMAGIQDGPDKELIVQRAQELGGKWTELGLAKQDQFVRDIVGRVVLGITTISVEVNARNFCSSFAGSSPLFSKQPELNAFKIIAKFQGVRRRGELHLIPPNSEGTHAPPLGSPGYCSWSGVV